MREYEFYYKGQFYTVYACTIEGALRVIRQEYSAQCARECMITKVSAA